jgi:hypothetical protein
MPYIIPQADPLVFMEFLSKSEPYYVIIETTDWQSTLNDIKRDLEPILAGNFIVSVDDLHLEDDCAPFIIRVDNPSDLAMLGHCLKPKD